MRKNGCDIIRFLDCNKIKFNRYKLQSRRRSISKMDSTSFFRQPLPTPPPPPPLPPVEEPPPQRLTLKSSQETIDTLRQENFNLKLMLHHASEKGELKKPVKFPEKEESRKKVKDAACQTHLNSMNIDELIKSSIILKRQQEKQSEPYPRNSTPQPSHRPQKVQKLCYPNVTLPDNTIVNQPPPKNNSLSRNLKIDEKSILETLCHVDGIMTTARDKLRAKSDIG